MPTRPGGRRTNRLTAALVCTVLALAAGAQTAQATTAPLRYVALGDSYSAASGFCRSISRRRLSVCAPPGTTRTSSLASSARS